MSSGDLRLHLHRRLRNTIIAWLGPTYQHDNIGNPDYYNEEDVTNLVEALVNVLDQEGR